MKIKMILLFAVKQRLHRTAKIRRQTKDKIPIKVKAVFRVPSKPQQKQALAFSGRNNNYF